MHVFAASRTVALLCPWIFPGKDSGVGLPFPTPEDLPNPGMEPSSQVLTTN